MEIENWKWEGEKGVGGEPIRNEKRGGAAGEAGGSGWNSCNSCNDGNSWNGRIGGVWEVWEVVEKKQLKLELRLTVIDCNWL